MKWIKKINFLLLCMCFCNLACSQSDTKLTGLVKDKKFDQKILSMISRTIPVIGVKDLKNIKDEVIIFDARKREEYEISHIPGAQFIGYKEFSSEQLSNIPKERKIILYCSIGYRSEKIGEKLHKLGYTNVYNLYGSIFEWANRGYPLLDDNGNTVQKVHTYNHSWSKWIHNQNIEKVW
jgi:rhodanese-related sulfurtransferase